MAILCGMPTIQYSARRLFVHKLFTSYIQQCLGSLPATEWCQRYLPFYLFTVSNTGRLFFHVGQPGSTAAYMVYPISDIGRCRKFMYVSCTERWMGNDFELILRVKWKLDIPYRDHLIVNFWRSVIIAESYGGLKSQDVQILW